jgi:UDP-N-acetylmuramoyl-tripeptide--D-alanyl-D-alanine ligase
MRPTGISFAVRHGDDGASVRLDGVLGVPHEYPVLAAAAVSIAEGHGLSNLAAAFASSKPPRGRMNLVPGMNGSTLVDDSYNSSPTALAAALDAVKGLRLSPGQRRIAVLGDMMELGQYSAEQHRLAGELAAKSADILVTVGQRARLMRDGALVAGMAEADVLSFDDSYVAADRLPALVRPGDIILIKGSQSPRMERVTKALMADPSRAAELLVRQDKEWLEKK